MAHFELNGQWLLTSPQRPDIEIYIHLPRLLIVSLGLGFPAGNLQAIPKVHKLTLFLIS